jgi:signal transduction histidine kinase
VDHRRIRDAAAAGAALDEARTAALQQQRLSLARELHDTVARDLVRASLRGQAAVAAEPSPEIEAVLRELHQASTHLRWLMALLREAEPTGFGSTASTGQSLARATESLRDHGLLVRTFVEGDLDAVPPALHPIVDAVVGEACANIERHADAGAPCAIMVNVSDDRLDAAFINHVAGRPTGAGYGLDGLRERVRS